MKIGVLTGGGDAPGLNAVIRAVTVRAIHRGHEVIGLRRGWLGMLDADVVPLTIGDVLDIQREGGTILGSARKNVNKVPNGLQIVLDNMEKLGLGALVAIGGEDTLGVARDLYEAGGRVVGVPKTIDNDVNATDYTFGFDTAVNRVMEALDRLHSTTKAHHRCMVVEIMGRHAGWMALHGGIAGGAHIILIPEEPFDTEEICRMIKRRHASGHVYTIVAVAEGAEDPKLMAQVMRSAQKDEFGHVQLSSGIGIGEVLSNEIEERIGIETRHLVLGHLQRAGQPSAFDRVLGTRFGYKVIEMIENGEFGKMASLRGSEIAAVSLQDAVGELKTVDKPRYALAQLFVDAYTGGLNSSQKPTPEA